MRAVSHLAVATVSCIVLAAPSVARAQTPFHARQWGADFTVGGFDGIGAIHFKSPDVATTLNLFGAINHNESSATRSTTSQGTLQLGRRRYRPLGSRVYGTHTLGIMGSWQHLVARPTGAPLTTDNTQYGIGVFGNLGAQWMVTNDLSLGAQWGVTFQYTHFHDGIANVNGHGLQFNVGGVGLIGALYF